MTAQPSAEERMRHASFELDDYPEGCESEAVGLLAAIEIANEVAAAAVEAVRADRDALRIALDKTVTIAESALAAEQSHERLRRAVEALPERLREIVNRRYFEDERFDSIALRLELSKSRVSRLHAEAVVALARALAVPRLRCAPGARREVT